jgi:hypothetical protein
MPKYKTTWLDGQLPSGQIFYVAVCGYSGRIRHMTIGDDPMRRMLIHFETVEGNHCQTAEHCLATDCPLNKTEHNHILHMLDMYYEEKLDAESAKAWKTENVVEGLLKFAGKMNEAVPLELRQGMNLAGPEDEASSENESKYQ